MGYPLAESEFNNVSFQNLLSAAIPLIYGKGFINTDPDELDMYARWVEYRVQRDLYELCTDHSQDTMTWAEFVLTMRVSPELRDQAMDVISRKLQKAFFSFDFTPREICFFNEADDSDEDILHCAKLFSEEEGIFVMSLFLYFAEQAHFSRLQDTLRPDYKLQEYYHDLQHDKALWREVLMAFRDALQRLRFKDEWEEVGAGRE